MIFTIILMSMLAGAFLITFFTSQLIDMTFVLLTIVAVLILVAGLFGFGYLVLVMYPQESLKAITATIGVMGFLCFYTYYDMKADAKSLERKKAKAAKAVEAAEAAEYNRQAYLMDDNGYCLAMKAGFVKR